MRLSIRAVATILVALSTVAAISAQLSFEVATIRRSTSLHTGGSMGPKPGRYLALNVPASIFIVAAYNLKSYQVIGGPDWLRTDRYNLEATTGAEQFNRVQIQEMMRSLLEERFKLRAHRETRQLDGYALVRVSSDRLGAAMQPSTLKCSDPKAARPQGSKFTCGLTHLPGSFVAGDVAVSVIADLLTGAVGRVVVDKTGISGGFDVELKWAPEFEVSDLPSIFTAVQEQLGLKLVSEPVPTEVLVIDHIERPTEN
jgi:uncharacterized protein (TIGR03435 family)